jgi:hypothetical protein
MGVAVTGRQAETVPLDTAGVKEVLSGRDGRRAAVCALLEFSQEVDALVDGTA